METFIIIYQKSNFTSMNIFLNELLNVIEEVFLLLKSAEKQLFFILKKFNGSGILQGKIEYDKNYFKRDCTQI